MLCLTSRGWLAKGDCRQNFRVGICIVGSARRPVQLRRPGCASPKPSGADRPVPGYRLAHLVGPSRQGTALSRRAGPPGVAIRPGRGPSVRRDGTGPDNGQSRSTAWRWSQEAAARAKALGALSEGRTVGTHTFRHSYARHLLLHGVPINYVSRWLGHRSIQTTLVYLELVPDPAGRLATVP